MRFLLIVTMLFASIASNALQYQCFTDEDCYHGEFCVERRCVTDYPPSVPAPSTEPAGCFSDGDCPAGEGCFDGVCTENFFC